MATTNQASPNLVTLCRLRDACTQQAKSRSAFYLDISTGLMTRPVKLGTASAWPAHEIDAVNRARIAGKTDDQIRQLVKKLEADRKAMA